MLTSDTFSVTYQITAATRSEAEIIAQNICVEQSVEMPPEVVPDHAYSSIAQLSSLEHFVDNSWRVVIKFPVLLADSDPTQLLNVIFGNSSLQPGIKVTDVESTFLEEQLNGPAFGISGIRNLLNISGRPLSCTALKPVGLSASDLAERAYLFSSGGIDIIKDDHGLTNQQTADFTSRVTSCVRAVRKGEQKSGKRTLYFPNITTSPLRALSRFEEAAELGADGVLISPQLTGLEIVSVLAQQKQLPVMVHPAFSGSMVIHESQGISAPLYYGKIWRAFGADCIVYPNADGRFSFNMQLCKEINQTCRENMGDIKPAFPTPGGGINRKSIEKWLSEYENDTIFLVGGSLYQHPEGLEAASKEFQQTLMNHD